VLRVLAELRPSGVEANLRATAPFWPHHGVEIEILATGASLGPYAPVLAETGYRIHHIPLHPAGRFAPRFLSLVRAGGYDVVHVHPERANVFVAGLARVTGRPVVRSVHNVFAYQGWLRRERLIQRAVLRRLGIIHVAVSTSVAAAEWRYFRNPTHRIFNCYDDTRFRPPSAEERATSRRALGVNDGDVVLASVGNCSPVKNHAAVLRALPFVGTDVPVVYVHVGLEQADARERAEARALGLGGAARFLGQVNDVSAVLAAADIFVMPSRYEGLANAALEALGCGLPAILSDVPGLRDLADLVPGIRWATPEPVAIAKAIAEAVASPSQDSRAAVASAAREHFGIEAHVARYADLYAGKVDPPAMTVARTAALDDPPVSGGRGPA
jgi:glycosyltransferase involved in cell wall biosynthesis